MDIIKSGKAVMRVINSLKKSQCITSEKRGAIVFLEDAILTGLRAAAKNDRLGNALDFDDDAPASEEDTQRTVVLIMTRGIRSDDPMELKLHVLSMADQIQACMDCVSN